jgi:hypothetical protein
LKAIAHPPTTLYSQDGGWECACCLLYISASLGLGMLQKLHLY